MDSLSQSGASSTPSPQDDPVVFPIEPSQPASVPMRVAPIDWIVRLLLFAVLLGLVVRQIGPAEPSDLVYPLLVYGALAAAYLLASVPALAAHLLRQADEQPLSMALLPLVLLLPVIVYARATPDFDVTELLFAGVLLVLPTACAILNTLPLRRADVPLGLITVALPILLPFARDAAGIGALPALNAIGLSMRAGAMLMPVLLVVLTTPTQKRRLNFLFACAALSLWFSAEFAAFPTVEVVPGMETTYFQLAVIPLFLYVVAVAGRFDRMGLAFQPTPRSVSIVSTNLALFAVVAVPLGLVTGFLSTAFAGPTVIEGVLRAVVIYLLVALPEEILFRGTLLTYLEDAMQWPVIVLIGVSAIIFGAAHLNNPPDVGWYFVLAGLAGVFYARGFLATRNVTASAVVHAAVNWVWWLLFKG